MKVLVTGASGYIGGRLVPYLLDAGHQVRCMSRDSSRLRLQPWHDAVEVASADALEAGTLDAALNGCDAAYYLIHSMHGRKDFAERDRAAARNFADAAGRAGLKRIIYLGGLGRESPKLSKHLMSRQEVGRILGAGPVPVTELRAAVIIGSGSASFELVRHVAEVLPVMMTPSWMLTRCQPIAIRNVLQILVAALEDASDGVVEIGGPEVLTYLEMIQQYCEVAGIKRRTVIPLPVGGIWLSTIFAGLITPLPWHIARSLLRSMPDEVVAQGPNPWAIGLLSYREAVQLALQRTADLMVPTRWSDAGANPEARLPGDPAWAGAVIEENRQEVATYASPTDLFWAVSRIGGEVGYYRLNFLWKARGVIDKMVGGVGLRRGRRHPEELRQGEALDFWRVIVVDRNRRLLLQAEMKLPGTAWLEWRIENTGRGCLLSQIASFAPHGLVGRIYWWALLPFHGPIFRAMAKRIARTAELRRSRG